jgi:hypothetical protein
LTAHVGTWHTTVTTAGGSWETLGGAIVTQLTVVAGPDHLDVFALGTDPGTWLGVESTVEFRIEFQNNL